MSRPDPREILATLTTIANNTQPAHHNHRTWTPADDHAETIAEARADWSRNGRGVHDDGGCFDLRTWDLSPQQRDRLVRVLRECSLMVRADELCGHRHPVCVSCCPDLHPFHFPSDEDDS